MCNFVFLSFSLIGRMDPSGSNSSASQQSRSTAGESTQIFVAHVRQYLATLPFVTVATFGASFAVLMCDGLGVFIQSPRLLSQWMQLDVLSIAYGQSKLTISVYLGVLPTNRFSSQCKDFCFILLHHLALHCISQTCSYCYPIWQLKKGNMDLQS